MPRPQTVALRPANRRVWKLFFFRSTENKEKKVALRPANRRVWKPPSCQEVWKAHCKSRENHSTRDTRGNVSIVSARFKLLNGMFLLKQLDDGIKASLTTEKQKEPG